MKLIAVMLMGAGWAAAQIGGGSIVGSVLDPTGAAVVGATVTAIHTDTNARRETRTNESGYYEFPLLPAGNYRLEAEAKGFRRATTAVFALNSGTRPRLDLNLAIGEVTEAVQVVGSAPIVNATTTDLGVVMNNSKVDSLPLNGRDWQQLVGLQTGVLSDPASAVGNRGGMEFHSASALGNNLLLDGIDMTFGEVNGTASDQSAGAGNAASLINTISVEAIEEFKAAGSAFSAEYGRAIGGVLNITTKSGTNRFHGTLFEYFRNDKLDANSFFSNRSGLERPPLRWNQFGGNVSGPIRRDRAFFFFNYEAARVRRARQITGNVPTPLLLGQLRPEIRRTFEAMFPATFEPTSNPLVGFHRRNDGDRSDEDTFLWRGDADYSKHRFSGRYSYNNQDFLVPLLYPSQPRLFPTRFHNAVFQDNWNIAPALFNELRLGVNRVDLNRSERNRDTIPAWIQTAGVNINANQPSFIHFITTTYTLADNLSYIRGKHSMKFGFEIRELRSARGQGGVSTHLYNNVNDLIADRPNRVRVLFGGGKGLRTRNYGFYAQDDWRLSSRLQLNFGLRYEYSPPLVGGFNTGTPDPYGPFTATAKENMYVNDWNNFAPRLGLVYDPLGNQKLVVRAGAGTGYLPQQPIFLYDMAFIDPRLPFVADLSPAEIGAPSSYPFPQSFVDRVSANPALLPSNFVAARQIMDFARRDSYGGNWNLSIQTAVTESFALQASYVGSRNLKLTSPRTLNLVDPAIGRRPRPEFGDVNILENAANISYHAVQLSANKRLSKGLSFDGYYTFGKALAYFVPDDALNFTLAALQDPLNIAGSYGLKQGDIRHRFVGVYSYEIPTGGFGQSGAAKFLLRGWTLQGILSWRSGLPINVTSGIDSAGNGRVAGQRPDLVAGADPYRRDSNRLTWLNPQAFDNTTPRTQRRFGNLGFNTFRGPSGFNWDGAVHKTFLVAERHRLIFRFEMFNAPNHKILSNPNAQVSNPNFGLIQGASGGRNIQLALKYQF
jgi:hypothetical protein